MPNKDDESQEGRFDGILFERELLDMCIQSPTSVRHGEDHGFIYYLH